MAVSPYPCFLTILPFAYAFSVGPAVVPGFPRVPSLPAPLAAPHPPTQQRLGAALVAPRLAGDAATAFLPAMQPGGYAETPAGVAEEDRGGREGGRGAGGGVNQLWGEKNKGRQCGRGRGRQRCCVGQAANGRAANAPLSNCGTRAGQWAGKRAGGQGCFKRCHTPTGMPAKPAVPRWPACLRTVGQSLRSNGRLEQPDPLVATSKRGGFESRRPASLVVAVKRHLGRLLRVVHVLEVGAVQLALLLLDCRRRWAGRWRGHR